MSNKEDEVKRHDNAEAVRNHGFRMGVTEEIFPRASGWATGHYTFSDTPKMAGLWQTKIPTIIRIKGHGVLPPICLATIPDYSSLPPFFFHENKIE